MKNPDLLNKKFPYVNALLLLLVFLTVFIVPILPATFSSYMYPMFFTGIFLTAAFSIKTRRNTAILMAILLTLLFWIAFIGNWETFKLIIRFLQVGFFLLLVMGIVLEISSTPTVTQKVILDSIAAYLLLGFAFSLLVTVVAVLIPNAYSYSQSAETLALGRHAKNLVNDFDPVRENIYYTFVTYTTTGYGDFLPIHPIAKSLAILISVSGQLYIAIIIAMLVGKYSASKN